MQKPETQSAVRPPIVAIVGHIDHGKSTLLDYIRKTNVVEAEAGGITQHLSAYEAVHKNSSGEHKITFLDTPGHEAFKAMRARGLEAADVAILVVSSEDGVKPQTLEALKLIGEAGLPYIVALTKIDKPGSNIEKAKMSLLEHQIFLEGMGGDVSWIGISSKSGEGIPELLDLILLQAELKGLSADADKPGSGLVIEAHVDPRRGSTATLIVHDGTIKSGSFVVAGGAIAPVRIMENFVGKPIKEALPGSPVRIIGFSELPSVGTKFFTVDSKKEAEKAAGEELSKRRSAQATPTPKGRGPDLNVGGSEESLSSAAPEEEVEQIKVILPVIIKTDVAGTGEAVLHEIEKFPADPRLEMRIVTRSVGTISENDVKMVSGGKTPGVILGFNVKVEREARDLAERQGVEIATFDIIYKLAEWLEAALAKRRPRAATDVLVGGARVLKVFSTQKGRVVLGGKVDTGKLVQGAEVRIIRRDIEIGRGTIQGLQSSKKDVREVESGSEFGAMLKTTSEPAANDRIESYQVEFT